PIRRDRSIEVRYELPLRGGWPAILDLKLQGKHPAGVQQDQVGHPGSHAERFHNGGLNRPSRATVWRGPPKKAANPTKLKVLAYGAWDAILGTMAAAHNSQLKSPRRSRIGGMPRASWASRQGSMQPRWSHTVAVP